MQSTLFEIPEELAQPKWGEMAVSLSFDETAIIAWIMRLHNNDNAFDVDLTYSTGRLWANIPRPIITMDISKDSMASVLADSRAIPLKDMSVGSIFFDPPFVVAPSCKPGIIRDRFSCYKNVQQLWAFYKETIIECYRVLHDGGIAVMKCQDIVSSGKNWDSHFEAMSYFKVTGFIFKDLFVLGRSNILWSPNMQNQQHARKNHCYYLVFKKPPHNKSLNPTPNSAPIEGGASLESE